MNAPAPIRLLVVDDHTLFRRGLIALLGQDPGLQVLGEAGDAAEALRLAPQLQPQVILLDNHLPGVMGVDAIRGLRQVSPSSRVLVLTVSEDAQDLATALRNGAQAWFEQFMSPDWASLTFGLLGLLFLLGVLIICHRNRWILKL